MSLTFANALAVLLALTILCAFACSRPARRKHPRLTQAAKAALAACVVLLALLGAAKSLESSSTGGLLLCLAVAVLPVAWLWYGMRGRFRRGL